jgi:hypothetical protein
MSENISGINSNISDYSPISTAKTSQSASSGSLCNFDVEDQSIISAEAKMLNELDKYNNGESNEVNLAVTNITSKYQVEAAVNVINTKNDMMEKIMQIGEE